MIAPLSRDGGHRSVAQLPDGTIIGLTRWFDATDLPGEPQVIAVLFTETQLLEA
ncbi:MAG: hypothetical protein NT029_02210 [Armatimonadetes bacterium]|nr:hypothetical protein [Armatimonadota bacterium]